MDINLSSKFKRSYKKLPTDIRNDFDNKIPVFVENPRDPRLKIHKLKGKLQDCLAFGLRDGHRVLFEFSSENTIDLLDIGSHDKYRQWER